MAASFNADGNGERRFRRIDDEHRQQARGLAVTGILADPVMDARHLEEALSGTADFRRLVVDLTADRSRHDIGMDEGRLGVGMRLRLAARRIVDRDDDQRLARRVGQVVPELQCWCLALVGGTPSCCSHARAGANRTARQSPVAFMAIPPVAKSSTKAAP
jgi:hypothetical protein